MILPDFVLPSRCNQQWNYSGIDSPEHCLNKKHFDSYPYAVEYRYNSRGYRDQEWPTELDQLQKAVWCVGDSFTVGVGSPIERTWPYLLQQRTGLRTINVSMDGASNEWILRKTRRIVKDVAPKTIVIQWSYLYRRESPMGQDDEQRRMQYDLFHFLDEENINNFKNCVVQAQKDCKDCQLINSIIPGAYPGIDRIEAEAWWYNDREALWPLELPNSLNDISPNIIEKLKNKQQYDKYAVHYELQDFIKNHNVILVNQYDNFFNKELARDGHHYDLTTSQKFIDQIMPLL